MTTFRNQLIPMIWRSSHASESPRLLNSITRSRASAAARITKQPASWRIAPRRPLSTVPSVAGYDQPAEEETLPYYNQEEFYPVHLDDVFRERYRVIGKLGFGRNSTVWLCRDLQHLTYVAVKIYVTTPTQTLNRELEAYKRLAEIRSSHPGRKLIRPMLDSFELQQSNGNSHQCMVHEPLSITLEELQNLGGRPRLFPEEMTKGVVRHLAPALDFLHSEASIAHCDVKLSNIMLTIEDKSVLDKFEEAEHENPCPRKVINEERTIYASRDLALPQNDAWGHPVLCDLGEARIGEDFPHLEIQPEVYKAPEIIMQTGWGHSIDIWNAACMIWDMMEPRHLFDGRGENGRHNNRLHVSEMVAYMGNPPKEFLRRSPQAWRVFDETGKWKGQNPIPRLSLEDRETQLEGPRKDAFLNFIRSMMTWLPEDRITASELARHPWVQETS